MTVSAVPFALQNVPINADVVRQAASSLIPNGGGLVQSGDLAVTQLSTAAMGVQVGVGRCWIDGTNLAHLSSQGYGKQGMYFILNDAAYTVTITTSDATNPRIDVIYVNVPDTSYAGITDTPVIAVATGFPAAGATYPANAPSIPANSLALAWVMVNANATSITTTNITTLATGVSKPFGHAGKTNGFTVAATPVPLAAQVLRGGMTFDAVNNALVIPIAGSYRITAKLYSSGGQTGLCSISARVNAGSTGAGAQWTKTAVDEFQSGAIVRPFSAGDKIDMTVTSPADVYGSDGYNGTFLEVEYVGPSA